MKDQTIQKLQERTRGLLLSIIYHQQLDMDSIAENAIWFTGSAQTHLSKQEMPGYLEQNSMDMPADTPQITYVQCGYMGQECISMVGELHYDSQHETEKQVKLSFHVNWIACDESWQVQQLITFSQTYRSESRETIGQGGLDYRTLIRSLPFAIICCTLEFNLPVQRISKKALALLDYESISDYRHHVGGTLMSAVHPEDVPAFISYVKDLRSGKNVSQISLRMRKKDFSYVLIQMYGTFVKEGWMVFACVDHTENQSILDMIVQEKEDLETEQGNFRMMLDNMPSGFHSCALFEPVHVDYVSDSLCKMTGYTREDIHETMQSIYVRMVVPEDHQVIADCVKSLMQYPHTEQVVYRMVCKDGRIIRVLDRMRSVRHADGRMWGYSVVLNLDDLPIGQKMPEPGTAAVVPLAAAENPLLHAVEIRTFGYFEVWVDGSPIAFRSAKARELLALLVDRRGNFISRDAVVSALWEEKPINATTLARCRKTYMNLVTELKNYGIEDIVETENGMRRIIPEKVHCDLFDYQRGDAAAKQKFKGHYMTEYSWSEVTLAALLDSNFSDEEE